MGKRGFGRLAASLMQGAGSGWSWWGSETVAGAGRIAVLRKVRTYIRLAPKKADLSVSLQARYATAIAICASR
jgi:hypothetical protein